MHAEFLGHVVHGQRAQVARALGEEFRLVLDEFVGDGEDGFLAQRDGADQTAAVADLVAQVLAGFAHADTRRAYEAYTSYYLSTSGQRYWSDTGQLSVYIDDYHAELDRRLGAAHKGTEMISELYVPRPALPAFLAAVRATSASTTCGSSTGRSA